MKLKAEDMRLYAVTASMEDGDALLEKVRQAIAGGAGVVQLREKRMEDGALIELARRFAKLCREMGAISIINDRADVAALSGADGVHVGQDDLAAERAREILGPNGIVGVSVHSVEEALRAQAAGADYLGVGAAFSTGTKADAKPIDHALYRAITRSVRIPVVAIGGITEENIDQLAGMGLAGMAVVSALFGQADVEGAARRLRARIERVCMK